MRILVTGAKGMLGTALLPVLSRNHTAWGIDVQDCDICDAAAVSAYLRSHPPDLLIHLAAYTNVDACEANPQIAEETNAFGTRNLAAACAEIGAAMLYVSTDYVFDGTREGAYGEEDAPRPINVYGRSKWMGEQHVRSILKRFYIVRASWLYGAGGKNFVTTILKAAHQQKTLRVVNDQRGCPTYTHHLSAKIAELIQTESYGTYHITGSGSCSWFEFAQAVLELWLLDGVEVLPISSDESGRAARRPANSVLENRALRQIHLEPLPHWKTALAEFLEEIGQTDLGFNDPSV